LLRETPASASNSSIPADRAASDRLVAWIAGALQANSELRALGLRIRLPDDGKARMRELVLRSRQIATGKYPSWKGGLLQWESPEEAKTFRLLDFCPAIRRFTEQPCAIEYLEGGSWKTHLPDVLAETSSGKTYLLEIKSEVDQSIEDALARSRLISPRLQELGITYLVVHQRDIDRGRAVDIARFFLRHGRTDPTPGAHMQLHDAIGPGLGMLLDDIRKLPVTGGAVAAACALTLRGFIGLNWPTLETTDTRFSAPMQDNLKESFQWLLRALGASSRS